MKESDHRSIDIVPLVVTQQMLLWFRDLEDAMANAGPGSVEDDLEEAFSLYRKAQKVLQLANAFAT